MSSFIRSLEVHKRIFNAPEIWPRKATGFQDRSALGPYATLVQKLNNLRQEQGSGLVVTFASVSNGEGVTSVVESLSRELAQYAGQGVIVTSPAALEGAHVPFRITEPIDPRRVWRLGAAVPAPWHTQEEDPLDTLRHMRERFGFILVDCPPLSVSSAIFSAAPVSDGVVLVVAAGQTKRRDVEEARRLLAAASVPIVGMVLNKHENYVPRFLSSLF
jgi:hypothetical protein